MRKPVKTRHRKFNYKALAFNFCLFFHSLFIKKQWKDRQKKEEPCYLQQSSSECFFKRFLFSFWFFSGKFFLPFEGKLMCLKTTFTLFHLAKFDVILIRFSSFSILYNFENDGFSTHYFSFHTLLVPIQYQLFFVIIVCSSGGLQVIWLFKE